MFDRSEAIKTEVSNEICFYCAEKTWCSKHMNPSSFALDTLATLIKQESDDVIVEETSLISRDEKRSYVMLQPLDMESIPISEHPFATPGLVVRPIEDQEEETTEPVTRPLRPLPKIASARISKTPFRPIIHPSFATNHHFEKPKRKYLSTNDTHRMKYIKQELQDSEVCDGEEKDERNFEEGEIVQEFIQEVFMLRGTSDKEKSMPKEDIILPMEERKRYQRFRQKKYVCDFCNNQFTLKQNVQTHIFLYHMNNQKSRKKTKKFRCLLCKKIFNTERQVLNHQNRIHFLREKAEFWCEICEKRFNSSTLLREHISISHLNERPYECEVCGSKFGRRGGLRRHHMMVHENYTYNCPYSNCSHPGYKCSKALAAHIRSVHTKDRPYCCDYCDRTFVRKNDLRVHEATHGVGGFECEKCKRNFSRRSELQRHQERVHQLIH